MLAQILTVDIISLFLVFCRVGTAIMLMPAYGEMFVSPQVRLILALALAIVILPIVGPGLTASLGRGGIAMLFVSEIGVGLFIGTAARMLLSALQVAGTVIAFQINLSSAFVFDPMSGQQGAITATFLSTVGVVLLFVTDLHHLLLRGVVESYSVFTPGALPPLGDFVDTVVRLTADSFRIGLQLSAPFLLIGILISVGMGLLSRLMPQVQIFFVAPPVQILTGLLAMLLTMSFGMRWFLEGFEDSFISLFLTS